MSEIVYNLQTSTHHVTIHDLTNFSLLYGNDNMSWLYTRGL